MKATPLINSLFLAAGIMTHSAGAQGAGSEPFDYPAGEVLTSKGSESDSMFSGPWYSAANVDIVAGSLDAGTLPALPTSGNHVFWNTDRGFRNLDKAYSGETDETVYISFLRNESEYFDMVYSAFELFDGGTDDKVNRTFALGALQNDSAGLDGVAYYERISSRMNNVQDTVVYLGDRDQTTSVELYVIKIELKANDADTISIWRNPGAVLGEPTAIVTDLPEFPLYFDRIALSSWDHPDGLGFKSGFDEVRIGSSLSDVMAADSGPETWYGYSVDANGWANAEGWISWVNVAQDPWVWSTAFNKFIYVGSDSGWIYNPK
jgi:hypothetical protein